MSAGDVKLPETLKKEMEQHSAVDWNLFIQHKVEEYLAKLKLINKMTEKSTLTEEDTIEIGRKINQSALKSYLKEKV